jgi:hypothetical protein
MVRALAADHRCDAPRRSKHKDQQAAWVLRPALRLTIPEPNPCRSPVRVEAPKLAGGLLSIVFAWVHIPKCSIPLSHTL